MNTANLAQLRGMHEGRSKKKSIRDASFTGLRSPCEFFVRPLQKHSVHFLP